MLRVVKSHCPDCGTLLKVPVDVKRKWLIILEYDDEIPVQCPKCGEMWICHPVLK
jgi:uncharacterized C2H2 Zn-finger protein